MLEEINKKLSLIMKLIGKLVVIFLLGVFLLYILLSLFINIL